MSFNTAGQRSEDDSIQRKIGSYDSGNAGPLLIAITGMHGNEPAGIRAVRSVIAQLNATQPPLRGRFLALAGNLAALCEKKRYLQHDLNRIWLPENVKRIRGTQVSILKDEDQELREFVDAVEGELAAAKGRAILVDLHSTSAPAPPFSVISDTIQNRRVALSFHIPVVLGLEEAVDGTLLSYFGEQGLTAVGIEGGQHDDDSTIENHESVLWLSLVAGGLLTEAAVPALETHRRRLKEATRGLPQVVDVIYRHGIEPDDEFEMRTGYANFHPVKKGEPVGQDVQGDVFVPAKGLLLLPRYQGLGDDGFFVCRPVKIFWLYLSSLMRGIGLDRLLVLLPGVRADTGRGSILLVDTHIARWLVVQVFHLLGFRRSGFKGEFLAFTRRPEGPEINRD